MSSWSEGMIARAIALQTLARKCVVLVDRCNWTGHECDVLAVTRDLRIIDVEIKISRSDLRADASKDKWWHRYYDGATEEVTLPGGRQYQRQVLKRTPLAHPTRVWKHYYAMPSDIWKPELLECLPSQASGILLLTERSGRVDVSCARRATPNRDAYRLKPDQVINIARLANLRMWDAYQRVENARADAEFWRQQDRAPA